MSFGAIINTVLIGPLKLVFEVLFSFAYKITENVGVSIVLLSLAINFLVLPLYRCADAMQERARNKEMELHDGIAHIKKTFTGDERMMMLQTYYKQNNYSPLSALSGSVSLLLEIPFFIAAYQFLSEASHLEGAVLGPISDLASPDALIKIGSLTIHVLPFIMTILNLIASVLFLKGAPLKSKIQLYAMAVFFLVFLYTSPSGLVFYWTLNNLFSLIKTIFYKLKNPRKVLTYLSSGAGILIFAVVQIFDLGTSRAQLASIWLMLGLQIPILVTLLKKVIKYKPSDKQPEPNKKLFIVGCLFMTVLLGLLIPSTYIGDQPQEFIISNYYKNPIWFLVSATCLSAGTFLVWFGVFYWLASPKGKVWFDRGVWIACAVMLVNYMFFGTNLGNISPNLQYDVLVSFKVLEQILNVLVILAIAVGMYFVVVKFKRVTVSILAVTIVAIAGMSALNVVKITKGVNEYKAAAETVSDEPPTFELSQGGQNVIVIMLDRAIGAYFPYALQEIENRRLASGGTGSFLEGFTYYSNVVSFGDHTNFATPALLGGYEYTPVEMNKRDEESLASKQNEANMVLPRIFTEQKAAGAQTAWADKAYVFDPVYTNYQWISDLSVYDEYPKIQARNALGYFVDDNQSKALVENKYRDFFCFSIMKTMPLSFQYTLYDSGNYNRISTRKNKYVYSNQIVQSISKAVGIDDKFMENYGNLATLSDMTKTTAENVNRFMFLCNNICHEPMLLNEETYSPMDAEGKNPEWKVDNTAFDAANTGRFTLNDGSSIKVVNGFQMKHYQTNVMTLLKLDEWFNHLKAQGLYDNTRIIIASDHGYYLDSVEEMYHDDFKDKTTKEGSLESYFPLLLVKDFNGTGSVQTDETFMTNADVPALAVEGIIDNPVNPATSKPIGMAENAATKARPQYIMNSNDWQTTKNNGNTFTKCEWLSVKDSIWDMSNWEIYKKQTVLKEHAAP